MLNLACYYREVYVSLNDFGQALSSVSPSIQRGYQVQVEKKNWEDVGGLQDVKKVSEGLSERLSLNI